MVNFAESLQQSGKPTENHMNRILIANRGEIAVRVIRSAQALGYTTVAVFSDADTNAPHVQQADQAVRLGPPDIAESYLNGDRVLAAAKQADADAIHPGYGFLSENPDFARLVTNAGMTWIGPTPEAMEIMGNKAAAKAAIANSDIPLIPGYSGNDQTDAAFLTAASDIGYPVIVKATFGGGGRGMRLVEQPDDLPSALDSARSESLKAFSSDELLLEKALVNPRHIEFQIFADQHGNTIHLGERDCSIQRRHQKVLEEAPSPAVSSEMREKMGRAAVAVAQTVNYTNAGTVEFLVSKAGEFYFIEMNTRLQVEHPVTELITGFDLVAWQLLIAEGDRLPVSQADVTLNGHAIEARLFAESPNNDFLPSFGTIRHWHSPVGDGVRVDHGLQSGQNIEPFYDAMIAKVITHGETRDIARRRLLRALEQTAVLGVETNRAFLIDTIRHPTFTSGTATTTFIEDFWAPTTEPSSSLMVSLAAALLYTTGQAASRSASNNWATRPVTFCFDTANATNIVCVDVKDNELQIHGESQKHQIRVLSCENNQLIFETQGLRDTAAFAIGPDNQLWIQYGNNNACFTESLLAPATTSNENQPSGQILAPLPGSVLRIDVAEGDTVEKGQSLLVLEAMKMEHTVTAAITGTVTRVLVEQGQQVTPRQLVVVIDADSGT